MASPKDITSIRERVVPLLEELHAEYKDLQGQFLEAKRDYSLEEMRHIREECCKIYVAAYALWQDFNGLNFSLAAHIDRDVANKDYQEARAFLRQHPKTGEYTPSAAAPVALKAKPKKSKPVPLSGAIGAMSAEQRANIIKQIEALIAKKQQKQETETK